MPGKRFFSCGGTLKRVPAADGEIVSSNGGDHEIVAFLCPFYIPA